jgi:uncharacterized protein (TIGR00251 family)
MRRDGNDLVLSVRVTPRARHNEVAGIRNGDLHVRTTAPPADGKANKAVVKLLADYLDVAPSRISLLRGETHRNKQFLVKDAANGL